MMNLGIRDVATNLRIIRRLFYCASLNFLQMREPRTSLVTESSEAFVNISLPSMLVIGISFGRSLISLGS